MQREMMLVALLSLLGCCIASDSNSTSSVAGALCTAYVECMAAARAKSVDCPLGVGLFQQTSAGRNGTASNDACEEAAAKQAELHAIIEKKEMEEEKCIADRAASAAGLHPKKMGKKKCENLSSRLELGEKLFGNSRIRKIDMTKDDKREKRQCARDARQLRNECRAIQKCCPALECSRARNAGENSELKQKKKELREAAKRCKRANKGGAKGDRKKKEPKRLRQEGKKGAGKEELSKQ